jgi:hypothetical protein
MPDGTHLDLVARVGDGLGNVLAELHQPLHRIRLLLVAAGRGGQLD